MIILIGGTGFIGKHLSIALHNKGIKNLSLSRNPDTSFTNEFAPSTSAENISSLEQFIESKSLKFAETLVYLASNSIPASEENTIELELERNIKPAIQTISKIASVNPKIRIIYLSSGGTVYGAGHKQPISESMELSPSTPYAYGKISIEQYLQFLANTTEASYTILRASNPVGKWHGNLKQGFIGAAINNICEGKPVQIYGAGNIVRDYIDADEIASAILMSIEHKSQSRNKIWNVGTGIGSSLNEIVHSLSDASGKKIDIEYKKRRSLDLAYNVLDCSKIKSELGWHAQLDLNAIIQKAWSEESNSTK